MTKAQVFALCDMYDLKAGEARGFSLLRREAEGVARPFTLVVVQTKDGRYFGYANSCPHTGVWLNVRSCGYLDEAGRDLVCSRHGARFDVETGVCLEGPCEGEKLEAFCVTALAGDVCLLGVDLVEDEACDDRSDEDDATPEITVSS